jgi:hypothetical protein
MNVEDIWNSIWLENEAFVEAKKKEIECENLIIELKFVSNSVLVEKKII